MSRQEYEEIMKAAREAKAKAIKSELVRLEAFQRSGSLKSS